MYVAWVGLLKKVCRNWISSLYSLKRTEESEVFYACAELCEYCDCSRNLAKGIRLLRFDHPFERGLSCSDGQISLLKIDFYFQNRKYYFILYFQNSFEK